MKKSSVKALNDLIIASFLTNFIIKKQNNSRSVEVNILPEKVFFIKDYISQHELEDFVKVTDTENKQFYIIRQSTMLKAKFKDWTDGYEVKAMNPADIDVNTLLFWVALFGQTNGYTVKIKTNLSQALQETLVHIFKANIKSSEMIGDGQTFLFRSFLDLYLLSKNNRPYVETYEMKLLLSPKEQRKLKNINASHREEVLVDA